MKILLYMRLLITCTLIITEVTCMTISLIHYIGKITFQKGNVNLYVCVILAVQLFTASYLLQALLPTSQQGLKQLARHHLTTIMY